MIYFDNAATSWTKPDCVIAAMKDYMTNVGANPGRSGHRLSIEAGRIVYHARENIAELFKCEDPMRVIFCSNATDALNLGIRGLLRKGDHAVTGSMEHNSVMRPLRDLERVGIDITVVGSDGAGFLDPNDIREAVERKTKLIVINHASNVVGSIAPVREIGKIARDEGILFMTDTAQTAGCVPIDMKRDNIDLLAFTGHKGLMGPQGTGGLVIGDSVDIKDIGRMKSGGTGSRSEFEIHPDFLPDRYESGTMNTPGLAGLAAGVDFVLERSVDAIHEKNLSLSRRFLQGIRDIDGLNLYGGLNPKRQTSTFSFTVKNASNSDIGLLLDDEYDIMARVGLHCAPTAHRTIGTFPAGTVRFGMGYFNRSEEVDIAIEALGELVMRYA